MSSNIPEMSMPWKIGLEFVSASGGVVLIYRLLERKSDRQLGRETVPSTITSTLGRSIIGAPTVGGIVTIQTLAGSAAAKLAKDYLGMDSGGIASILSCSLLVSTVSAGPLAVFNNLTTGKSFIESFKGINVKQMTAIVIRETAFLGMRTASQPINQWLKDRYGEQPSFKYIDYVSLFTLGFVGSVAGHPADTYLTLLQKGAKVVNLSQLMRGGGTKGLAIGLFFVFEKYIREILTQIVQAK
jgi:hypothetical protein